MAVRVKSSGAIRENIGANALSYRGCIGMVTYDDEAGIFHVRVDLVDRSNHKKQSTDTNKTCRLSSGSFLWLFVC